MTQENVPGSLEAWVDACIEAGFDASSRSDGAANAPRFVMVCGTPASGKTRLRHAQYARGFVHVDAGDLFRRMPGHEGVDFPGRHPWILDGIGSLVAQRALMERRHVVTEVFSLEPPGASELIELMKAVGYTTEAVGVRASVEQSMAWNEARGIDNVSSYFTDEFNVGWLHEAARAYLESNKES